MSTPVVGRRRDVRGGPVPHGPCGLLGLFAALVLCAGPVPAGAQVIGRPSPTSRPTLSTRPMARILPPGPAPTGVVVAATGPTAVSVTWTPPSGAVRGYRIVRAGVTVGSVPADATTFVDRSAMPNTTYAYAVEALYDPAQASAARSAAASATTPRAPQPAALVARVLGEGTVRLSWDAPAGASGYVVSRDNGSFLNGGQPLRGTAITDRDVPPGTHTYRVIAYYDVAGVGEIEGDLEHVPAAQVTLPRWRGRYRVTLNGFRVNRETWDHALEVDGKRDEVFFAYIVTTADAAGGVTVTTHEDRTLRVYGDVNGFSPSLRTRAGSASTLGGLRTGDVYPPVANPWTRPGPPLPDALPLAIWEGPLVRDSNLVVIVPSVWEWDGGTQTFAEWEAFGAGLRDKVIADYRKRWTDRWAADSAAVRKAVEDGFRKAGEELVAGCVQDCLAALQDALAKLDFDLTGEAITAVFGVGTATGGELTRIASQYAAQILGQQYDRPIGLVDDGHGGYAFAPQLLRFGLDEAEAALAKTDGKGPGIIEVTYADAERLKGSYTLYLQIERLSP